MRDTKVVIAVGATVFDNRIKQQKISIDKLFDKLAEPKIRKKKDGPYFVFASFNKNERNAFNVKFYYGATLDVDYNDMTPKEIRKALKPLKTKYCIYSTFQHNAPGKGNRYRIVMPYREPVHKEKHVETVVYLNSLFGATGVDTSSKALSRPMYFPACPKDRENKFYFYESRSTKLLNPEKHIELDAHIKWEIEELNSQETEKVDITEEIFEGGRNDHIARVTGTLIQQGKTLQEIIDFCDEINQLKFSPQMRSSEVARTVKSIWKSHTRNHGDKDWGYLQLLERIRKSETIENDLDHLLEGIALSKRKGKTSSIESQKLLKEIKKKDKDLTLPVLREGLKEKEENQKSSYKESKSSLQIDDIDTPVIDKIKKEFKDYYFVASQNLIYNRKYETYYKLEGFNNQYSNLKQDFGNTLLTPFKILDDISGIQKVDGVKYHPGKPKTFTDYNDMLCLNSYKKSKVKPFKGRVKPLLKHFKYLFPNDFERNIILDFIAYNYQNPGKKLDWTPVIKGRKGIGKSIIANYILAPIFGNTNIRQLNNSQPLLKEFNSWQTESQIVVIHELYLSNKFEIKQQVTENIKSFITDPFQTVRKMFSDIFQQENVTNMMAFTNHEDMLYITPDERRFCMIRCEVEPKGTKYYDRLVKFLKNNEEAVAYYFKIRKIKTIDPHVLPITKYTKEIMNSSRNWAESILFEELHDSNSSIVKYKVMTWNAICHTIMSRIYGEGRSIDKYENMYNATTAMGRTLRQALIEEKFKPFEFSKGQNRVRINGRLEKLWFTPRGIKEKFHHHTFPIIKKEASKCVDECQIEFNEIGDFNDK